MPSWSEARTGIAAFIRPTINSLSSGVQPGFRVYSSSCPMRSRQSSAALRARMQHALGRSAIPHPQRARVLACHASYGPLSVFVVFHYMCHSKYRCEFSLVIKALDHFFLSHEIAELSSVNILTLNPAFRKAVSIKSCDLSLGLTKRADRDPLLNPKASISSYTK